MASLVIIPGIDHRLKEIESRIDASTEEGIRARWEFGRELLAGRIGKKLPDGLLEKAASLVGKSREDIQKRVRFAELYATESELCNAVTHFGSWHRIVADGLKPKDRRTKEGRVRSAQRSSETSRKKVIEAVDSMVESATALDDRSITSLTGIRDVSHFIDRITMLPWLTIERQDAGKVFKVDVELRRICETRTPRHDLDGISVNQFLQRLRNEIHKRRKDNQEKRKTANWNPDPINKLEQAKLLDWIEAELSKIS